MNLNHSLKIRDIKVHNGKKPQENFKKPLVVMMFIIVVFLFFYSVYYYREITKGIDATIIVDSNDKLDTYIVRDPDSGFHHAYTVIYPVNLPEAIAIARGDSMQATFHRQFNHPQYSLVLWNNNHKLLEENVNRELGNKFFTHPPVKVIAHDGKIAYANLTRKIDLRDEFYFAPGIFKNTRVRKVVFHGQEELQGSRVNYVHEKNFVVSLKTREGDELIIAVLPPATGLTELFETAMERLAAATSVLGAGDRFSFPQLDFAMQSLIEEDDLMVQQQLKFMIDAHKPRGSAVITKDFSRNMDVGSGFLLALKKSDVPMPYLLMWIGNNDLLKKQ